MRIYLSSSWRNKHYDHVLKTIREEGYEVYSFKNPAPGDNGFHWSEIDVAWESWTPEQYRTALQHPLAQVGFAQDKLALLIADVTVLVLPCERSSHLELGYAAGIGQRTAVLMLGGEVIPELMYNLCSAVCVSLAELGEVLHRWETERLVPDVWKEER